MIVRLTNDNITEKEEKEKVFQALFAFGNTGFIALFDYFVRLYSTKALHAGHGSGRFPILP